MTAPHRHAPSRRYMIQQAILNACADEWSWMQRPDLTLRPWLVGYTAHGTRLGGNLHIAILRAFSKVKQQYEAG